MSSVKHSNALVLHDVLNPNDATVNLSPSPVPISANDIILAIDNTAKLTNIQNSLNAFNASCSGITMSTELVIVICACVAVMCYLFGLIGSIVIKFYSD